MFLGKPITETDYCKSVTITVRRDKNRVNFSKSYFHRVETEYLKIKLKFENQIFRFKLNI